MSKFDQNCRLSLKARTQFDDMELLMLPSLKKKKKKGLVVAFWLRLQAQEEEKNTANENKSIKIPDDKNKFV